MSDPAPNLRQRLTSAKTKSVLGTRLIVAGLAGVCLAGGVDYFENAEQIKQAVAGVALDVGQTDIAAAVEQVDQGIAGAKAEALDWLPTGVRERLALIALLGGLAAIMAGLRLKLKYDEELGRSVRDVGRMIAAPGFVGIVVFTVLALRSHRLRTSFRSFWQRLGDTSLQDLYGLTGNYAPWAWNEVGGVLVLGLVCATCFVVARVLAWKLGREAPRPKLEFAARFAFWVSVLFLTYYAAATAVAVASYGGALTPYMTWPWKLTPGAFMTTVAFMAGGIALARTGTRLMRAPPPPDPDVHAPVVA